MQTPSAMAVRLKLFQPPCTLLSPLLSLCAGGSQARGSSQQEQVPQGQADSLPGLHQAQAHQQHQLSQPSQQYGKHRTRKAKAQGVPYTSLQPEQQQHMVMGGTSSSAGADAAAAAASAGVDQQGYTDGSDEDWEAGSKARKRHRSDKAANNSRKRQQQEAPGCAAEALDWCTGHTGTSSTHLAAAGMGSYGFAPVYDAASFGSIIAAAAAAGAAVDPAAAAAAAAGSGGASGAAALQDWQWLGCTGRNNATPTAVAAAAAAAAAAGGGVLTPQLAAAAAVQHGWGALLHQLQYPHAAASAGNPSSSGKPALPAVDTTLGQSACSSEPGAAAAEGDDDVGGGGGGAELYEDDAGYAEALQAAEALASLDNSRSSSLPLNSPSNASSRRPQRTSLAAAAAAGAHMRQPDYSQEYHSSMRDDGAEETGRVELPRMQQEIQGQKQQLPGQQVPEQGPQSTLQQLLSLSTACRQSSPNPGGLGATGVTPGVMLALASMLLPGVAAAAAAASAGTSPPLSAAAVAAPAPAAGSAAGSGDSRLCSGPTLEPPVSTQVVLQQEPHVTLQQPVQQEGQQGATDGGSSAPQQAAAAQAAYEAADSWGLNAEPSPLPNMLMRLPQTGSECSLRDMLHERYGSSGTLAAAAEAADVTPLEATCSAGAGVSAAAAAAASVAERRYRRSRLAEAQPGLQQLLATPNAVTAGLLANTTAAAAAAAAAGSGGAPASVGCGMQGDFVSCFPALSGPWNAGVQSGRGVEQQQTTPSNILIATQHGDPSFSIHQQLRQLLDSAQQQRSRGSGSSNNAQHLQAGVEGDMQAHAGVGQQQGPGTQLSEQGVLCSGTQHEDSPTSPDDGLLQQQGQQVLGCLLNTPYPLLYRTTNTGAQQQQQEQELQQQQQPPQDSTEPVGHPTTGAATQGGRQAHQSSAGCGYQSAAAAIEDAARYAGKLLAGVPVGANAPQRLARQPLAASRMAAVELRAEPGI